MAGTTPNLGLRQPTPDDPVNVIADISNSMGTIDTAVASKAPAGHNHAGDYDPAGTAITVVGLHEADTTNIHGIPDTAVLVTSSGMTIAINAAISAAVAGLVGAAPANLDTLAELATAIGNDPNFTTTVTNALANKISVGLVDAKGDLIVATAADTVARLPVGSNDQILTADSAQATGMKWAAAPTTGISPTIVDAKGDIIAATAADTVARLAAGSNGQFLTAQSGQATGLQWATHDNTGDPHSQYATDTDLTTHAGAADPHTGYVLESLVDAKGDILTATADNTPARLAAGTNGQFLTAQSGQATGLQWAADPTVAHAAAADPHTGYVLESLVDAKGDILTATADNTPARLAAGTNGQILTAQSGQATGLQWATHDSTGDPHSQYATDTDLTNHAAAADPHTGYVLESLVDAKGDLIVATADNTVSRLAVGTNNQVLIADSTTGTGLKWGAQSGGTTIVQQTTAPGSPVTGDLWIDTDEGAETGLSSIVGYAEVTANQTGISAETDLTGLTTTVTVPAGRRLRISAQIGHDRTVADGNSRLRIKEGATVLQIIDGHPQAAAAAQTTLSGSVVLSPSAGSHTYKLSLQRDSGTGTLSSIASATAPAFILVEDITGTLWPAGQSIGAGTIASEAWLPWTPVWTGTLGNGLLEGKYSRIGRFVAFSLQLDWGSTTSHPAAVQTFSLPVAPRGSTRRFAIGVANLEDTGTSLYDRTAIWNTDAQAMTVGRDNVAINNTIPFTWGNTDKLWIQGTYEAAS